MYNKLPNKLELIINNLNQASKDIEAAMGHMRNTRESIKQIAKVLEGLK